MIKSRVLVLAPTYPFPTSDGLRLRISQAIYSLSSVADVTLLCFAAASDSFQEDALGPNRRFRIVTVPTPAKSNIRRLIDGLLQRRTAGEAGFYCRAFSDVLSQTIRDGCYDICLVMGGSLLHGYLHNLKEHYVVADVCDDIAAFYTRRALLANGFARRAYLRFQGVIFRSSLRRDARFVSRFVVISRKDGAQFVSAGIDEWSVVPNFADHVYFQRTRQPDQAQPVLLFVGNMGSVENRDAVDFLFTEVLPDVRSSSSILVRIVGKGAKSLDLSDATDKVEFVDYVEDLATEYASCSVFICPLRLGSGVKNKVLQAMASGCAIVTTSIGAEGIGCSHGNELLLADDPEEFASAILALLNDRLLRDKLGRNARRFASEHFVEDRVARHWQSVLNLNGGK